MLGDLHFIPSCYIHLVGKGKGKSAFGQVAHQAEAYLGFCSMKRLGVFLLSLDVMLAGPS